MDSTGIEERVAPEALERFCQRALEAVGVGSKEAAITAASLLDADLRGIDTHGIPSRLPNYLARLRAGGIDPKAEVSVVSDNGAICVLDAQDGLGQVAAARGTSLAIERAGEHGVGIVAVRRSNHIGVLGHWSRQMAERGMAGFALSGAAPRLAPWGGTERLLGSNPWSWAYPVQDHPPLVVDVSNGVVIFGKIAGAAKRGEPLPEGWALDENGQPTTDAQAGVNGSIMPFGGAKGAALTLALEVLGSVLTGAAYSKEVPELFEVEPPQRLGHFLMALKVDHFMPLEEFERRTAEFVGWIENSRPASGVDRVRVPGSRGAETLEARSRTGISIGGSRAALDELAEELGIEGLNT